VNIYKVTDSETHWIVAESEADATAVMREQYDDEVTVDAVQLMPDDHVLSVLADGALGETQEREVKTCAEWAASEPRGLLASTVW